MALEIERKFLIINDNWRESSRSQTLFRQGYLTNMSGKSSVRIRIEGDQANINIKSMTLGISRSEFEYAIPLLEAQEMLDQLCIGPLIEKTRYEVVCGSHVWEIDEFAGDNQGLVVAEIELQHAEESFEHPDWLGQEVSDDKRYYNVSLIQHPYKSW